MRIFYPFFLTQNLLLYANGIAEVELKQSELQQNIALDPRNELKIQIDNDAIESFIRTNAEFHPRNNNCRITSIMLKKFAYNFEGPFRPHPKKSNELSDDLDSEACILDIRYKKKNYEFSGSFQVKKRKTLSKIAGIDETSNQCLHHKSDLTLCK